MGAERGRIASVFQIFFDHVAGEITLGGEIADIM
jgi:hypothetical protein